MCENSCKISVIVPIYNVEKYLPHCIESILAQTFTDFELLLVDDGSTDGSGWICDTYAQTDSRVKFFHTENKGVSAARNLGIKEASADWICFVDSDDWVEDDYLSSFCYETVFDNKCIVCQRVCLELEKLICEKFTLFSYSDIKIKSPFKEDVILCSEFLEKDVFVFAKLFKKDILTTHNIFFNESLSICEDVVFLHTYLLYIEEICLCSSACYHHIERNIMSLSKKFHSSEELVVASNEMLATTGLLLKKFQIHDIKTVRRLYTLYGLSSFYTAFINVNKENYSLIFTELKKRRKYFIKYYLPFTLKQKIFVKLFSSNLFHRKIIFAILGIYRRFVKY